MNTDKNPEKEERKNRVEIEDDVRKEEYQFFMPEFDFHM